MNSSANNATANIASLEPHTAILLSIWTIGIFIAAFSILIILLSKSKLILLEFYILMTLSISIIGLKIAIESMFIFMLLTENYFEYCIYSILNLISLALGFYTLLTMFYYSLFQASNVSRTRLFVMVHELVHKKKTFVIYQVCMGVVFGIFFPALHFFLAYRDLNECPNVYTLMNKFISNGTFIAEIVITSSLPILVYISTSIYIVYCSYRRSQNFTINARSGKNLKVMLKFLALASILVLSNWLLNLTYFLPFFTYDAFSFIYTGYLSFVSFSLLHLVMIFIHSITKMTLKIYFFRIFKSDK
jgi:hypothetical protein